MSIDSVVFSLFFLLPPCWLLEHELIRKMSLALWHFLTGTLGDYRRAKRLNDLLFVFLRLPLPTLPPLLSEIGEKWSGVQLKHSSVEEFFVGLSKIYFPLVSVISFILYYSSVHFLKCAWEVACFCNWTFHLMMIHFVFRNGLGNRPQFVLLDQTGMWWKSVLPLK